MVGYREEDSWTDTPPIIEINGSTVHLIGFASDEPASVIVVGHDGHHLTLRVIPPQTTKRDALDILEAIRQHDGAGRVADNDSGAARSITEFARRLARRDGIDDEQRTAEIQRWCVEAAERFQDAPVQTFVPILVEHIVRNRINQSWPATVSDAQCE